MNIDKKHKVIRINRMCKFTRINRAFRFITINRTYNFIEINRSTHLRASTGHAAERYALEKTQQKS